MTHDDRVASTIHKLVLTDFPEAPPPREHASKALWQEVLGTGTQLWLDTGDLEAARALWCAEFSALTTNNTLLNKEVQKGIYDALIAKVAGQLRDVVPEQDLVIEIAFLLNAVHGLRLVHAFGGKVSVELHTDLAGDVDRTLAYARRYHAICPEHFIVKVPMTPAGFVSVRKLAAEGIPINYTLGFGARQNYLAAAFSRPAYVNVFLGRLNSFVADHELGDGMNVGEKATLATQRAVIELRGKLGVDTHLIAASMRGGPQVAALAGVDVFTMPTAVAEGFEAEPTKVRSQVENDPAVTLAAGVDADAIGLPTLWDVPEPFRQAVDDLLAGSPDTLAPDDLVTFFADAGLPDLLVPWSADDIAVITGEGKIPVLDRWRQPLADGRVGLDALMNVAALCSFCVDQGKMDDRIRGML